MFRKDTHDLVPVLFSDLNSYQLSFAYYNLAIFVFFLLCISTSEPFSLLWTLLGYIYHRSSHRYLSSFNLSSNFTSLVIFSLIPSKLATPLLCIKRVHFIFFIKLTTIWNYCVYHMTVPKIWMVIDLRPFYSSLNIHLLEEYLHVLDI